jgi:hypothetical protein
MVQLHILLSLSLLPEGSFYILYILVAIFCSDMFHYRYQLLAAIVQSEPMFSFHTICQQKITGTGLELVLYWLTPSCSMVYLLLLWHSLIVSVEMKF